MSKEINRNNKKIIMKQFENLKVGDIVWTIQTGYSKVTSISDTINYPILVDGWASYTLDGKWGCRDQYNSLYFENPFEEKTKVEQLINLK